MYKEKLNSQLDNPVLERLFTAYVHSRAHQNKTAQRTYPLTCEFMVGVRRFELLTSSVSGKRSPPELNAHALLRNVKNTSWGTRAAEAILRDAASPCKSQFCVCPLYGFFACDVWRIAP